MYYNAHPVQNKPGKPLMYTKEFLSSQKLAKLSGEMVSPEGVLLLHYVNRLEPGSLFGEMALQSHRPRNATVIVGPEPATLAILNKYDFETHLAAGLQKETEERLIFFLSSVFKDCLHPGLVKRLGYDFLRSEEKLDKDKTKTSPSNPSDNRVYVVMTGVVMLECANELSTDSIQLTSRSKAVKPSASRNRVIGDPISGANARVGVSDATLGEGNLRADFKPRNYKHFGSKAELGFENSVDTLDSVDDDEGSKQELDVIGHDGNLYLRTPPNTRWNMVKLGTGEIIGLTEAIEGKKWPFAIKAITDATLTSVSAEVLKAYVVANPQLAAFAEKHMTQQYLATRAVQHSRQNATVVRSKIAAFDKRQLKVQRAQQKAEELEKAGAMGSKVLQDHVMSNYTHPKPKILKMFDKVPTGFWRQQEKDFDRLLEANHSLFFLGMIRKGALLVRPVKDKRNDHRERYNHLLAKKKKPSVEHVRSISQLPDIYQTDKHQRSRSMEVPEGSIYVEYSFDPTDGSTFAEHNTSGVQKHRSVVHETSQVTYGQTSTHEPSIFEEQNTSAALEKIFRREGVLRQKLYMPSASMDPERIRSVLCDEGTTHSKMTLKMRQKLAGKLLSPKPRLDNSSGVISRSVLVDEINLIDRSLKLEVAPSWNTILQAEVVGEEAHSASKPDHGGSTCCTDYTKKRNLPGLDANDKSNDTLGVGLDSRSQDSGRHASMKHRNASTQNGITERLRHQSQADELDSRTQHESMPVQPGSSPTHRVKVPLLRKQHTVDALPSASMGPLPRITKLHRQKKYGTADNYRFARHNASCTIETGSRSVDSAIPSKSGVLPSTSIFVTGPSLSEVAYQAAARKRMRLADNKLRQLMHVSRVSRPDIL